MDVQPSPGIDTGWDFSHITPYGGVRGRRIEAAIAAIALLNPNVAAVIPRFVVGTFWLQPDAITHFNVADPNRYQVPDADFIANTGMTAEQIHQILWNEQFRTNFYVFGWMVDKDPDNFLTSIYRGEAERTGFEPHQDSGGGGVFVPGAPGYTAPLGSDAFAHPFLFALKPGQLGRMTPEPILNTIATDHMICDRWFDTTTDVNYARYIRNWARSKGVPVALDPGV